MAARAKVGWDAEDTRFERVQRLFAMGRTDKADEGRAILRELVKKGPPIRRDRRKERTS